MLRKSAHLFFFSSISKDTFPRTIFHLIQLGAFTGCRKRAKMQIAFLAICFNLIGAFSFDCECWKKGGLLYGARDFSN